MFRLEGESGKCAPISLTTLGRPNVLACGSTALLSLSGDWAKLAALRHCPILIQINLRYSSAQTGIKAGSSLQFRVIKIGSPFKGKGQGEGEAAQRENNADEIKIKRIKYDEIGFPEA